MPKKEDDIPQVPISDSRKINIHLDGTDFQGFTFRLIGVAASALLIIWLTDLDEALVFLCVCLMWLSYFFYKIIRHKEEAYQQIIEDLETRNTRLEKSNKLLQNVVQDSLGMKVSTDDKSKEVK
jgi:hypothetical protein